MQGAKENVNTTTITIDILREIREDFILTEQGAF